MPKIKTHSGAKKRFSVTRSGKIKMSSAKRRHDIKGCKSTKLKRQLRRGGYADDSNVVQLKRLIPYK